MKKLLLVSTTFFFLTISQAQNTFQKTVGDEFATSYGYSITQANDGGYAICGFFDSWFPNYRDVYVLKFDVFGNLLWTKTIGGTSLDAGNSIIQTSDNGYAVCGYISTSNNDQDVYVMKLDSIGNLLWSKTVGGSGAEIGNSIIQTPDGGYAIGGYTTSYGAGYTDIYALKLDSGGSLLWTKTIGGTNGDEGQSIIQADNGGYVIAGSTRSYGEGNHDVYIIKLDSNANLLWTKTVGGTGWDDGMSVVQTNDGGYAICGYSDSNSNSTSYSYVVKLDSSGSLQWTKHVGANGFNTDNSYSIFQTADGGYALGGFTTSSLNGEASIVKLDSAGSLLWAKSIGGNGVDVAYSILQSSDGGYVMCGYTSSFSSSSESVYFLKFDSIGNICGTPGGGGWAQPSGGIEGPGGGVVSSGGIAYTFNSIVGSNGTQTDTCLTGVNELKEENMISVFPNPFYSQTTIHFAKQLKNATLIVYNSFGQEIKQINNISGDMVTLSRDNLPIGLYFIRLTEHGKTFSAEKLVITDN